MDNAAVQLAQDTKPAAMAQPWQMPAIIKLTLMTQMKQTAVTQPQYFAVLETILHADRTHAVTQQLLLQPQAGLLLQLLRKPLLPQAQLVLKAGIA
ncbi:MAG: hypothetical protein HYU48_01435 [Candidatus Levybacteria bacterium]|nr:hypothetical protein [Candidatus Levybacteria bacterium]